MSLLSSFLTQSGAVATTVFTSNGTFTATQSKMYLFMLQGGGGGGGGLGCTTGSGMGWTGGGGGGRFLQVPIYMTSGQTAAVVVGAAGLGSVLTSPSTQTVASTSGGSTTVTFNGITYSAQGGGAAQGGASQNANILLLAGQGAYNSLTVANAQVAPSTVFGDSESGCNGQNGASGQYPFANTSTQNLDGVNVYSAGGSSRLGKGGYTTSATTTSGAVGAAGTGYGAGGSGLGINSQANGIYWSGGNGSPGICYVIG